MNPAELGKATITPTVAYAGKRGRWDVEYTAGKAGIKQGGSLRLVPPHKAGGTFWELGKVMAFCDNPDVSLEVRTEKTYPRSYHHSHYPAVTVFAYGTDLREGDTVRIILGALGGYLSGRFIQTRPQTHAGDGEFELYVDRKGNAHFSGERFRQQAYQKVEGQLAVEVRPAAEARIRCTIRNSPGPDKDLIGVVSVEDEHENPIRDEAYDISLSVESGSLQTTQKVTKPAGQDGVSFTVKALDDTTDRVAATCWERNVAGVSNPVCPGFCATGRKIYFGDMHVMTGACAPSLYGDTESALKYARDVFGLDFTSVTNWNPEQSWPADSELFKKYNNDHEFVTLPGYENGLRTGHKNVYFPGEDTPVRPARTYEELFELLADRECLVISHHSNTTSESDPEQSWGPVQLDSINPKYERLIEICQNRGSFEVDQVGGEVSFGGYGSSVRDFLAAGLRLGFVGGTDTHRGRPGSPLSHQSGLDAGENVTGGITGVLCDELTRPAIWEALKARRCYATTSVRILLHFDVNGLMMGRDVQLTKESRKDFESRTIRVKAAGTYPIDRIVIVRNGEEVHTRSIDAIECEVEWDDEQSLSDVLDPKMKGVYYYAKVYQHDGNMAWASPVWLTHGSD